MSDRRFRWATTSARIVIGTAVAAGFAVVVATAVATPAIPWPTVSRDPVSVEATPAPAASVLACAGDILALGRNALDAATPVPAAAQTVTSGVTAGDPEPETSVLRGAAGLDEGGTVLTSPPVGGRLVDAVGTGSAVVAADDLRGYAASACRPPLMESWIIGGSTTTGSADIVLLGNPGAVAATVELTIYGTRGPVVPPGGAALVVPAGSQLAVPLAGLALGEAGPVVRVSATGAPVTASLQTSLTRTLVPIGVDQVGAVPAGDTDVVIPGMAVTTAPGIVASAESASLVRILSPVAETTATVTLTRVGTGELVGTPQEVPLTAGIPAELDLGALPVGQYTVRVAAAVPVVAAARQIVGAGDAADFAWYTPAPLLSTPSLVATPSGLASTLTLVGEGDAETTVQLTPVDGGAPLTVTVPAGGSATATLPAATVYLLDPRDSAGAATVRAGVSIAGDGALAAFPVWPSDAAARTITVYP